MKFFTEHNGRSYSYINNPISYSLLFIDKLLFSKFLPKTSIQTCNNILFVFKFIPKRVKLAKTQYAHDFVKKTRKCKS